MRPAGAGAFLISDGRHLSERVQIVGRGDRRRVIRSVHLVGYQVEVDPIPVLINIINITFAKFRSFTENRCYHLEIARVVVVVCPDVSECSHAPLGGSGSRKDQG